VRIDGFALGFLDIEGFLQVKARMKDNKAATGNLISGDISVFKTNIITIRAQIAKSRQTIRSVIALLTSNITSSVLTAIGGLVIAHFLGPEEIGSFRSFTIPLMYLMFLHLGTTDGLWRQIPYYVGKEMPERVDALASAAGSFMLFLSFVFSLGFVCCATYCLLRQDLYGFFGWLSQAFFCWEVFYGSYLTSTYRTLNHFVTLARVEVTKTILTFGMVFLLPFLRFYGLCARVAFPSFLVVWLYHRNRPLKVTYRFNAKALGELLKIGLPFSFWGSLYTSSWFATESALVLSLGGVTALGLFSIAYALRSAMNSFPEAVWQVMLPRVVTNLARDGSARRASTRIAWVTIGLTGLMIVFALVFSFLLNIFVPLAIPRYVTGIPVMKVCLWFPVVQAAFLPMNTLFATGRGWLYGRSVIAGIVVFPLATFLLHPIIGGLLAVAVGSLLGRVARTLAAYVDLVALARRET
jgi:O-antigen/teichoic acid export membrane protein